MNNEFIVWLRIPGGVIGIDYRELNDYIQEYNSKHLYRYVDFWPWLSYECFEDREEIHGFSALNNPNISKVRTIKS